MAKLDRRSLVQEDIRLHQLWKQTVDEDPEGMGDPDAFRAVFQRVKPIIRTTVRNYSRNYQIPEEALMTEASNWAIKGIRKFDPIKYPGTQLVGFVSNYLHKLSDFAISHQNMARITNRDARLLGDLERSKAHLTDMLGQPPSDDQLATYMRSAKPLLDNKKIPWDPKYIQRLREVNRKDLTSSGFEQTMGTANVDQESEEMFANMLRMELQPDERTVFDHMYGLNGVQKTTQGKEIAQLTGFGEAKVSRMIKSIMNKWNSYGR